MLDGSGNVGAGDVDIGYWMVVVMGCWLCGYWILDGSGNGGAGYVDIEHWIIVLMGVLVIWILDIGW